MIGATDYVGLGTLVTAIGTTIVSIIVVLRQTTTHTQIADVQNSVRLSNGKTIGEAVEAIEPRIMPAEPPNPPAP